MSLRRLSRWLSGCCETVAALILTLVCLLNFSQVVGRYLFGSSFGWAEETMRYSMMWVMMLGSVAAIYHSEHMAVDTLLDRTGTKHKHLVKSILYGIGSVFCILLIYYGWQASLRNMHQIAAASGIPMVIPYMAIPIGSVIMLLQIVLCWVSGFRAPEAHDAL